jgi:hypothetical protein
LVIPEKTRLEKLLGMLGSSFDGERANAARMISAMAERQGLTVVELIYGARAQEHQGRRQQKPKPRQAKNDVMPDTILKALAEIADDQERYGLVLTEWEFHFAVDVSAHYSRDYELSAKQLAVVENIIRKARRATAQK